MKAQKETLLFLIKSIFTELNKKSIRDAKAKNKYKTQFDINYTDDDAQASLTRMLSVAFNEYLETDETQYVEKVLEKINRNDILLQGEIEQLVELETKLNKIALKQHSLVIEAEISLADKLFGTNCDAAVQLISSYKEKK